MSWSARKLIDHPAVKKHHGGSSFSPCRSDGMLSAVCNYIPLSTRHQNKMINCWFSAFVLPVLPAGQNYVLTQWWLEKPSCRSVRVGHYYLWPPTGSDCSVRGHGIFTVSSDRCRRSINSSLPALSVMYPCQTRQFRLSWTLKVKCCFTFILRNRRLSY